MKDEKQLVLFFSKNTKIEGAILAAKLTSKFSVLGPPAVIPFSINKPNQPLIVFNKGPISLNISNLDVSFIYDSEGHEKTFETVIEIIEYLEDLDYFFERMGYVSSFLHSKKERKAFKENIFKDPDMFDSEFQVSWYKKELIDSVSVNVWEKDMTDMMNGIDFLSVFDINTPIDEVYNITAEFLDNFIKKCDKYIANHDKKFK